MTITICETEKEDLVRILGLGFERHGYSIKPG